MCRKYYKIYNKDNYTLLRYMKRGIKMKRKDNYIELIFSSCKYDSNVTVKEFENYLINTENMKK